jgi:hypothetical protein
LEEFMTVASPQGRSQTFDKLQRLIKIDCECAGIKTDALFSYIPNIVNLTESQQIAQCVLQVYQQALELYTQQSPPPNALDALSQTVTSSSSAGELDISSHAFIQWTTRALKLVGIDQIAMAIEPGLHKLREQHLLSKDRRSIGFITTQFHFSTQSVLRRLTLPEQVLLRPYFRFIEDQTCMPLQRVCAAAARYNFDSPTLSLVGQLLPASQEIASNVYRRAAQLYPNHRSLRGGLNNPDVMISTLRDLQMFQGYLWLCVLEQSMAAAEQELLPLSILVFPSVSVSWDLVRGMLELLVEELVRRVTPELASIFQPYTQALQQLFSDLK